MTRLLFNSTGDVAFGQSYRPIYTSAATVFDDVLCSSVSVC